MRVGRACGRQRRLTNEYRLRSLRSLRATRRAQRAASVLLNVRSHSNVILSWARNRGMDRAWCEGPVWPSIPEWIVVNAVRRPSVAVMLCCLAAACTTDAELPNGPGLDRVRLEPAVRIGEVEGPRALNDILAVTVGPGSEVYVAQWQTPYVAVFDNSGAIVRRIGRRGQGPGELSQPGTLGWIGDTLWVADQSQGVVAFSSDGRFLRQSRFRRALTEDPWGYVPWRALSGGRVVAHGAWLASEVVNDQVRLSPLLLTTDDGVLLDTIALVPPSVHLQEIRIGERLMYHVVPGIAEPSHAFGPGGLLALLNVGSGVDGHHLSVAWVDEAGDTLASSAVPVSVQPFPAERRDSISAHLARLWTSFWPDPEAALRRAAQESIEWPVDEPVFTAALIGQDSRLWLRREVDGDSVRWEIWKRTGPVADTWLPKDLEIHYADARRVWGERKNSLDVPFLIRYDVVPESQR